MKRKVIFSECSYDLWVEVAATLARDAGWDPCYWVAVPEMRDLVTAAFPGIVFHSNLDAVRGIRPPECADLPASAADQPLFERHAWHESIVLKMMDRMDPGDAFSHAERVRLYETLLTYWSSVLDRVQPHLALFSMAPHLVYDYVLYVLCRERGIRTVMLDPIYVEGLVYPLASFEEGSVAIREMYERLRASDEPVSFTLSPESERHLARISGAYSEAMPFYLKEKIDEITEWRESRVLAVLRPLLAKLAAVANYPRYCVSVARRLHQHLFPVAPRNYLKQKGKAIEDSWMSGWEYRVYRMAATRRKRRLADYYARFTREPDLDRPYVFVALHYQPERTTSPGGGAFADQLRMVDLVAKAVPTGWSVYVKEHPGQLAPFWKGELCRTTRFYDDLAAMPNVRLVPLSFSPFPLIDHARAVVTVSGTIGWESVIRGKPVLAFGQCWYSPCEGVFYTPSLAACREALAQVEAGYKVDHAKVRLFMHVLERQCFRGYIDHDNQKVAGVSHADNVVALATALRDFAAGRS